MKEGSLEKISFYKKILTEGLQHWKEQRAVESLKKKSDISKGGRNGRCSVWDLLILCVKKVLSGSSLRSLYIRILKRHSDETSFFDATPLVYPGKINLIEKIRHLPEDKYTNKIRMYRSCWDRKEHWKSQRNDTQWAGDVQPNCMGK